MHTLQEKLEEERRKLREDAEKDRAAVLAKFSASHVSEREQELELALIQVGLVRCAQFPYSLLDVRAHVRLLLLCSLQIFLFCGFRFKVRRACCF